MLFSHTLNSNSLKKMSNLTSKRCSWRWSRTCPQRRIMTLTGSWFQQIIRKQWLIAVRWKFEIDNCSSFTIDSHSGPLLWPRSLLSTTASWSRRCESSAVITDSNFKKLFCLKHCHLKPKKKWKKEMRMMLTLPIIVTQVSSSSRARFIISRESMVSLNTCHPSLPGPTSHHHTCNCSNMIWRAKKKKTF